VASRTTTAAGIAWPKRYAAHELQLALMPAGLLSQASPPEHSLTAAAASLSLVVYSYPLPLALLLLPAPAQGFQLMLNTELISYFPSFSVVKIRPNRVTNYSTPLSISGFAISLAVNRETSRRYVG